MLEKENQIEKTKKSIDAENFRDDKAIEVILMRRQSREAREWWNREPEEQKRPAETPREQEEHFKHKREDFETFLREQQERIAKLRREQEEQAERSRKKQKAFESRVREQ